MSCVRLRRPAGRARRPGASRFVRAPRRPAFPLSGRGRQPRRVLARGRRTARRGRRSPVRPAFLFAPPAAGARGLRGSWLRESAAALQYGRTSRTPGRRRPGAYFRRSGTSRRTGRARRELNRQDAKTTLATWIGPAVPAGRGVGLRSCRRRLAGRCCCLRRPTGDGEPYLLRA